MSGVHNIQLFDKPPAYPHVCAKCGSGSGREHYVDIGLDAEFTEDQQGAPHIKDGVIYFCNMCLTDLISQYLYKLFDFINGQRQGLQHEALRQMNDLTTLHNEIDSLRSIIDNQAEQIRTLQGAVLEDVAENSNATADELVGLLLGDNDGAGINVESDKDSTGTNQSADGNGAAIEFDNSNIVSQGTGILGGTISIRTS